MLKFQEVLEANHNSGELHCPVTALIRNGLGVYESTQEVTKLVSIINNSRKSTSNTESS